MSLTAHVYQIHINADADQVWAAITQSEWKKRYFHGTSYAEGPTAGRPLPDRQGRRRRRDRRDDRGDDAARAGHARAGSCRPGTCSTTPTLAAEPPEPGRVDDRAGRRPADPGAPGARRPRLQPAHLGQRQGRLGLGARRAQDGPRDRPHAAADHGRHRRLPRAGRGRLAPPAGRRGDQRRVRAARRPSATRPTTSELLRLAYAAAYHWERASGRRAGERRPRPTTSSRAPSRRPASPSGRWLSADRVAGGAARRRRSPTSTSPTSTRRGPGRCTPSAGADEAAAAWRGARAVEVADPEDRAIVEADFAADAAVPGCLRLTRSSQHRSVEPAVVPAGAAAAAGPAQRDVHVVAVAQRLAALLLRRHEELR